jgi:hypothetical protein
MTLLGIGAPDCLLSCQEPQPDTNLMPVTGWSSAKFAACGFCVCGMSKKPTPVIVATAPSCFQLFVGCPHAVVNFFRAAMIALRSRVC